MTKGGKSVSLEGRVDGFCDHPHDDPVSSKISDLPQVPSLLDGNTKYVVLFVSTFASFAQFYAMDNPSALYGPGEKYMGGDREMEYSYFVNLMYTCTGVPNIVWGFLVGPIISRLGLARSFPAGVFMAFTGQVVVAIGIQFRIEIISLVGRVLLGTALEFTGCSLLALIAIWMQNQVGLGMAVFNTANRLGTVVNNMVSLKIAESTNVPFAYWFSAILLSIMVFGSRIIYKLESKRMNEVACVGTEVDPLGESQAKDGFLQSLVKQLKRIPSFYWVVNVNAGLILGISLAFNNTASALVIERACKGTCCPTGEQNCDAYINAEHSASFLMSIPYLITIVGGPMVGFVVDRVGLRGVIALFGWSLVILAFSLFSFTEIENVYLFSLLGVSMSIVMASSFPCVPMVVEQRDVGASFALVLVSQSALTAILPVFIAIIRNATDSYIACQPLFLGLACLGFLDVLLLNYVDSKHDFRLNKP